MLGDGEAGPYLNHEQETCPGLRDFVINYCITVAAGSFDKASIATLSVPQSVYMYFKCDEKLLQHKAGWRGFLML